MAERVAGIWRPLANGSFYSFAQRALGGDHARRVFVSEYLKAATGERILDLGCGAGDILSLLPSVVYVGVDHSPNYVAAAQTRFGDRAQFICADVRRLALEPSEPFDVVVATGLLHHLGEEEFRTVAATAASVLASHGRMVTIDAALTPRQAWIARWLITHDRGLNVRTPLGYYTVMAEHFSSVSCTVRQNLLRVPYTHVIITSRLPRPRQAAHQPE